MALNAQGSTRRVLTTVTALVLGVGLVALPGVASAADASSAAAAQATAGRTGPQADADGVWKQDSKGWWYRLPDGSYPAGTDMVINGVEYTFDAEGYMRTGWVCSAEGWRYYHPSGARAGEGWVQDGGTWYYMKGSPAVAHTGGWLEVGGAWYYMDSSGAMATGWVKVGEDWYFMQPSGAMATGWLQLGDTWYYLQSNGVMAYGIVEVNGVPHAFEINGAWVGAWDGTESEDVAP